MCMQLYLFIIIYHYLSLVTILFIIELIEAMFLPCASSQLSFTLCKFQNYHL